MHAGSWLEEPRQCDSLGLDDLDAFSVTGLESISSKTSAISDPSSAPDALITAEHVPAAAVLSEDTEIQGEVGGGVFSMGWDGEGGETGAVDYGLGAGGEGLFGSGVLSGERGVRPKKKKREEKNVSRARERDRDRGREGFDGVSCLRDAPAAECVRTHVGKGEGDMTQGM